jgi:HlyD family secretion protein
MAKKEIFRSAALARMSSPEQLDQLLHVTTSKAWIAMAAVLLILGTAVTWGLVGRLATKSDGRGVAIRAGTLLSVGTLSSGQVTSVFVKSGDHVKKNQLIATIAQPATTDKIKEAEAQLEDAEKERDRQAGVRSSGMKLEMDSVEKQRDTFLQQIKSLQEQSKTVADQIPVNEELFAKGLITRQQILSLKERQSQIENQIAGINTQLAQLNSSEFKLQNGGRQMDADGESRIVELERNLRLLRSDLDLSTKVTSPYSGQVIEVQIPAGGLVGPGTPIVTLQPDVDLLQITAFVPATSVKEIKPGMDVEIIPSSVRPEEYGFIRGKVTTVADFPSTEAALMRLFQNDALVKALAAGGPMNQVDIEMLKNPNTPSGYEWSSKNGAPIQITPATLCAVRIVTREQQPITMVLPYLKNKLGME